MSTQETVKREIRKTSSFPDLIKPGFKSCEERLLRIFNESLILAQDERWRRA